MPTTDPYWALYVRHEDREDTFGLEFGDYSASAVQAERADYRARGYRATDLIVKGYASDAGIIPPVITWRKP